jgi:HlyD family secretion protein
MKFKIPKFLKNLFAGKHKKRNIWIAVILLVIIIIGYFIFGRGNNTSSIQIGFATKQNLQETVLSTGQVISGTDLSLSFQGSGIVRQVYVKEGDKVNAGKTLAVLDQSSALASLTSAQGSLAQAKANYDKLIAGTNLDNINTGTIVIESRKIVLDGAYNNALNDINDADLKAYNALATITALQNTYFTGFDQNARDGKTQMQSALGLLESSLNKARVSGSLADKDNALSTTVSSLNIISSALKTIRDTLDETYYYGIVPDSERIAVDTQRTNINNALDTVINDQQTISNDKISLLQSQPEIDSAKGQVLSAQGQVDAAQAVVDNSIVRAPEAGTITSVDVKVGEQATPSKEIIILQDVGNLHAEADVSEANVASLQVGQPIDYTFDALGPDQHFAGKVLTINPASTVISGVVDYKVTGSLDNIPNIKPGMTANMTILVAKKDNVLAVPSTAIINNNSKQYVKVIDDSNKKTYHQVQVQTGLQADGGLVEITSGLTDGQEIVTYIKP